MEEEANPVIDDTPTIPLEDLITKIRSVSSGLELDDAVTAIKPGMSNCDGRRKLKRTIEQVLKKSEVESSMNAKIRRKVTRAVKFLQPGNPVTIKQQQEQEEKKKKEDEEAKKKKQEEAAAAKKVAIQQKQIPHIIFIGQLPFQATAQDIQDFLQSKVQLQGKPKVRLLTRKGSNESKGMAFVELSSGIDLSACLALHKSLFRGRAINIEKSCGGKNKDVRNERLKELREEQTQQLRNAVTEILEDYSKKGVINLRTMGKEFQEKLISRGPEIVAKALSEFKAAEKDKRSYQLLDHLLEEVVQKSAVKQNDNVKQEDGIKNEDTHISDVVDEDDVNDSDASESGNDDDNEDDEGDDDSAGDDDEDKDAEDEE